MKAIQFRKLIREEVRRALKEVAGKAYALVIDEDGNFMQEDLASYFEETAGYEEPTKLTAAKVAKFPTEFDAWANAPELAKAENVKWVKAVASLNATCDFYDVLGDGGENAFIAAVPKGSNVEDFMGEMEEGFRKGLKEAGTPQEQAIRLAVQTALDAGDDSELYDDSSSTSYKNLAKKAGLSVAELEHVVMYCLDAAGEDAPGMDNLDAKAAGGGGLTGKQMMISVKKKLKGMGIDIDNLA